MLDINHIMLRIENILKTKDLVALHHNTVYTVHTLLKYVCIHTLFPRMIAPQSSEYNLFLNYWNNALYRNSALILFLID